MKATSFQKPLEFKLAVEGEAWNQGDPLAGTLTIKNHGTDPVNVQGARVILAHGNLDDVRKRAPDAFVVIGSAAELAPGSLAPQAEVSHAWKFELAPSCPITDKSSSLFLLYGSEEALEKLGNLQLVVVPHQLIQDFISLLTIEFQFVLKIQKSSKGAVEIKFAPPSAKNFAMIENLIAAFRLEGETLLVKYVFSTKKLDSSAGMTVKKEKQSFELRFSPSQYLLSNGRLNHEKVGAAFREVLGNLGDLLG